MFRFDEGLKVYLHREAIDFRVGLNGLAILVEQALGLDPFAEAVYVFRNRRRDRVKILGWQRNGFWMLMKRLEEDRFIWPDVATVPTLTVEQLHWLLDGIDLKKGDGSIYDHSFDGHESVTSISTNLAGRDDLPIPPDLRRDS
ncbi:IS66 family insertion sequence element accessory protein TnpB [Pseudomonas sp. A-B-19]|uniref:IS66 family insertion sequence element accessory protein TnpB n=1 Tax=Pseudomonas sp. A-B-19 TaxID=2832405 RepID=UPI001CBE4123|nr:IS66 family insertion sequence element accessory protein TnpB [Pseudomonas sp. A-B-19]